MSRAKVFGWISLEINTNEEWMGGRNHPGIEMSRVKLSPKEPEHEVVVGWDRPLNTYFAQVWPPEPEDPHADHHAIVFRDVWTPQQVIAVIDEYAVDDDKTKRVRQAILAGQDPKEVIPT